MNKNSLKKVISWCFLTSTKRQIHTKNTGEITLRKWSTIMHLGLLSKRQTNQPSHQSSVMQSSFQTGLKEPYRVIPSHNTLQYDYSQVPALAAEHLGNAIIPCLVPIFIKENVSSFLRAYSIIDNNIKALRNG